MTWNLLKLSRAIKFEFILPKEKNRIIIHKVFNLLTSKSKKIKRVTLKLIIICHIVIILRKKNNFLIILSSIEN